jgi:ATP-dependent DNA helicase PIF1
LVAADHEGGRTSHSLFAIPVRIAGISDSSAPMSCRIAAESPRAELLRAVGAFCWDEVPMTDRLALEGVDRLMRFLTGSPRPFGGKLLLLGGDFRQIPPVVTGGDHRRVYASSVRSSFLWREVECFELTHRQRDRGDPAFSAFVDSLGDGAGVPAGATSGQVEIPFVQLPLLHSFTDAEAAAEWVHVDALAHSVAMARGGPLPTVAEARRFALCAILSPRNVEVDAINTTMVDRMAGPAVHLYSADSVRDDIASLLTSDALHSAEASGVPSHALVLKVGCVVMALRNLAADAGVVNGARLLVIGISRHLVHTIVLKTGRPFFIPRINFDFEFGKTGITICRRQFPLRLCYALTINKAQGQNLERTCINLRGGGVFSHGQLYVAWGRSTGAAQTAVLLTPEQRARDPCTMTNVCWRALLSRQPEVVMQQRVASPPHELEPEQHALFGDSGLDIDDVVLPSDFPDDLDATTASALFDASVFELDPLVHLQPLMSPDEMHEVVLNLDDY